MPGSSPRGRALVLGSDTRAFLTVVRSLGRSGVAVDVAWCPRGAIALRSRYVQHVHDLPLPGAAGWLEAFRAHVKRERYDLVIPCDDPSLLPLQAHAAEVEQDARIYLLRPDVFEIVNDKARTYDLAARLGVSVPRQEDVTRATDAAALIARLGLPLVLKPVSSFTLGALHSKREVRVLRKAEDVASAITALRGDDTALAQSFFEGVGRGVEVLAADGEVLVAFQHRRVHEPLDGGGSSYRVSERPDAGMLAASRALIAELRYTGVAMIEFKQNAQTGAWILVEINGRFWGSLPLAVAAGADFPAYLYDLLVLGRRDFPSTYRVGVHARNWERDLAWLAQHVGALRRGRKVSNPLRTLAGELPHLVTGRERSDTFTLDDPQPGLAELRGIVAHYGGAITGRLTRRLADTGLARRGAERRALAAWRDARSVLFVCKGNICRSPFAEVYARSVDASGRRYASSGFYPIAARPSPDTAIASATHFGIDLAPHRSSIIDDAIVAGSDAIFVFEHAHVRQIVERFPASRQRVHLLGALDRSAGVEILDPYSHSESVFRACYGRIQRALDRLTSAAAR
jgi:protein-tyrosine-phosphatase/predicted ATP-grasp superfamily ATP-dependent carboligase